MQSCLEKNLKTVKKSRKRRIFFNLNSKSFEFDLEIASKIIKMFLFMFRYFHLFYRWGVKYRMGFQPIFLRELWVTKNRCVARNCCRNRILFWLSTIFPQKIVAKTFSAKNYRIFVTPNPCLKKKRIKKRTYSLTAHQ